MVKRYRSILLLLVWMGVALGNTWAVEQTFVTISSQTGTQDTSSPAPGIGREATYLEEMEKTQGALTSDRLVSLSGVSLDFYRVHGSSAVGFEVKLQDYTKQYAFSSGSTVDLSVRQFLYGVNAYHRGGWYYPFIGAGSGSVYVKLQESVTQSGQKYGATVYGQVPNPYYYQAGIRFPFGMFGILLVRQYLAATVTVDTQNAPLELGGEATILGFSVTF
jgi:hypothetical protein